MSIQAEPTEISREDWIAAAKQVYLDAGDTEVEADECTAYLCAEEDWSGDDLQDPCEAAKDDIAGRPQPKLAEQDLAHTCAELGFEMCEFLPDEDGCDCCNKPNLQLYFQGPEDAGRYFCAACLINEKTMNEAFALAMAA